MCALDIDPNNVTRWLLAQGRGGDTELWWAEMGVGKMGLSDCYEFDTQYSE